MSDIEQQMWAWLESPDAAEPGACFILSPRSVRGLGQRPPCGGLDWVAKIKVRLLAEKKAAA